MKTQDEELDGLFSAKLADMEVGPSAAVWDNIAAELDVAIPNQKKRGLPFMRIAAGIVVVMGISLLLFRPHSDKVMLRGDTLAAGTKATNAVGRISLPADRQIERPVGTSRIAASRASGQPALDKNELSVISRADSQYRSALAEVARNNKLMNTHPAVMQQVTEVVDVPANTIADNKDTAIKSLTVVSADPAKDKSTATKRRKIHSLGDILNVVIAKVDKRDDKIIEFTNTRNEDDSFTITGINLGLIKAKKEQ